MTTYKIYEYDFVLNEKHELYDVIDDNYNAALDSAKILASQWCEGEKPKSFKIGKHTAVCGDSDFGAVIITV